MVGWYPGGRGFRAPYGANNSPCILNRATLPHTWPVQNILKFFWPTQEIEIKFLAGMEGVFNPCFFVFCYCLLVSPPSSSIGGVIRGWAEQGPGRIIGSPGTTISGVADLEKYLFFCGVRECCSCLISKHIDRSKTHCTARKFFWRKAPQPYVCAMEVFVSGFPTCW